MHIAHSCGAMCKTDNRTVQHFVGLEAMGEIAVVASHRFNCFGKIVLSMNIKSKFELIKYGNITIRFALSNKKIKKIKMKKNLKKWKLLYS